MYHHDLSVLKHTQVVIVDSAFIYSYSLNLGFSILGSHPSSVSWVQFHSFCSCTGDLEYELSSLAPGLQNRIHVLGLEPTRVAGPTRRKDLRVRRGGGKGKGIDKEG